MSELPMTVSERNELRPVCPFCEKELSEIYIRTKGFALWVGKDIICFCPYCHKVLGFAQSRMA